MGLVGVNELVVTEVDAQVGDSLFICILKKDKVAWLRAVHIIAAVVIACCGITSDLRAGLICDIIDEPAAIKAGQGAAAPYIWRSD